MTKVVIVGEIYEQNVQVGGGPMPGGGWGGPVDPGYGRPGGPHVSTGPIYGGGHPSGQPVYPGGPTDPGYGNWGGGDHVGGGPIYHPGHPEHGLPSAPAYPTGGPIVPPQGGTDVPESDYQPLPPPEDIYSQVVVSVWDPKTATWTTKTYPPR